MYQCEKWIKANFFIQAVVMPTLSKAIISREQYYHAEFTKNFKTEQ